MAETSKRTAGGAPRTKRAAGKATRAAKGPAAKATYAAKDVVRRSQAATANAETEVTETANSAAHAASAEVRQLEPIAAALESVAIRPEFSGAFDVPPTVREAAERGVRQFKDAFERFQAAAEGTTGMVEESYASTTRGVAEFQVKALEAAKANAEATLELARNLVNARSFSEAVELQTAFFRRQYEAFTAQARDFASLGTRISTEVARPMRAGVERAIESGRRAP